MRIHHHFLPHHHDGFHHRAHAISLGALFVYLQLLIFFGSAIYFLKLTSPHILGTATFSASEIISLTNQKRAENHLPVLTTNPFLTKAAFAKAENMFGENYWAHYSPSGKSPWFFITSTGYKYIYAGENLARDFSQASPLVDAWMNSSTHKANILDKNFKEIGVAVVSGKLTGREGVLVVQMFGSTNRSIFGESSKSEVPLPLPSPPVVALAPPPNLQATVLASNQFYIAKSVSLGLISFIFILFLAEVVVLVLRRREHLTSGVLAHVIILGFLLLAVWYSVSGAIL